MSHVLLRVPLLPTKDDVKRQGSNLKQYLFDLPAGAEIVSVIPTEYRGAYIVVNLPSEGGTR